MQCSVSIDVLSANVITVYIRGSHVNIRGHNMMCDQWITLYELMLLSLATDKTNACCALSYKLLRCLLLLNAHMVSPYRRCGTAYVLTLAALQ